VLVERIDLNRDKLDIALRIVELTSLGRPGLQGYELGLLRDRRCALVEDTFDFIWLGRRSDGVPKCGVAHASQQVRDARSADVRS
jgi:hypothetical protein